LVYVLSNIQEDSFYNKFSTGTELKSYLHEHKINHKNIDENTLVLATKELFKAFSSMNIKNYDIDHFGSCNMTIYEFEECTYSKEELYQALSLISISLIDLEIIEIENE